MESEEGPSGTNPAARTDANDARAALDQVSADRARLAQRMASPRWVGPAFGALVAALLLSPLFDDGWWRPVPYLLGVAAAIAIWQAYRAATGVTQRTPTGRAGVLAVVASVVIVLVLYCAAALFAGMQLPWAVAALAAIGLAAAWLSVPALDRAVAWDLAHGR